MAIALSDLHTDNSYNEPKLLELRMALKWEGYGLYWALIEKLVSNAAHILPTNYNALAWELRADSGVLKRVVCDFGLFAFTEDGSGFYSEKLLKQRKAADELSKIRSEAGKKGMRQRWKGAGATGTGSITNNNTCYDSDNKPITSVMNSITSVITNDNKSYNKTSKEKEVEQEKESNNNTRTLFTRDEVNNNINNNLLKKESEKERKISLANIDVVEDADGGIYHLADSTRDVLSRLLEVFQKRDPKRLDIRPMELQALMKLRADIGTSDADEQILSVLDQFDALPVFQPGGKFQGWNMLTLLKYKNFDMVKSGMFNVPQRQDAPNSRQGYGTMHTKVEQPVDDIPF